MAIDKTALEAILCSLKYVKPGGVVLTLGRQSINVDYVTIKNTLQKYNKNITGQTLGTFSEYLFSSILGAKLVESIDFSLDLSPTIVHNMNNEIPDQLKNRYDYIYDCGTIETMFDTALVIDNISNMLKVGGIFCSVTACNNFFGHGMYQFSPEFFLAVFSEKYGMVIHELYLTQIDSEKSQWVDVKSYSFGRNTSKFKTSNPVYIISIIEKISDVRLSVKENPPKNWSDDQMNWKL